MNKPYLYILARNDLPSCNAGKMMAQVCHAQAIFSSCEVSEKFVPLVNQWKQSVNNHYGTTIVLSATLNDILNIQHFCCGYQSFNENCEFDWGMLGIVQDPTYPFIVDTEIINLMDKEKLTDVPVDVGNNKTLCCRKEVTCMYVFGEKDVLSINLKNFHLHP